MRSPQVALLALGCVLMLSACQILSGLEKLQAEPTPITAGEGAQTSSPRAAAGGGKGGQLVRPVDSAGGAGAALASGGTSGVSNSGGRVSDDQSMNGGGTASSGSGGTGTVHNSSTRGDMGGRSSPPAADGGNAGTPPMLGVPASTPPQENDHDDSMEQAGDAAPPQGGAPGPSSRASRAGAAATEGGRGGSASQDPACVPPANGASCTVNPQCGCDTGQACDFLTNSANDRVPACRTAGRNSPYSQCSNPSDCGAAASCVDNYCSPYCKTDWECGDRYALCAEIYDSDSPNRPPVAGFASCDRPCDPADLNRGHGSYAPCAPGRACMVSADGRSYCRDKNPFGEVGVSCRSQEACAIGNACLDTVGCVKLCRNDSECPTGNSCRFFNPSLYAASVEWGYCAAGA